MFKKLLIIPLLSMIFVGLLSSKAECFYFYKNFRDIHGRVLDADTGEPIAGVVVMAGWGTDIYKAFDIGSKYYDAYTVATDSNGDFTIPGKGPRILTRLQPPYISLYKSGYRPFGASDLLGDFKKYDAQKDEVKWLGERAVIPLIKMTMKERKERGPVSLPAIEAPLSKVILWLMERDKEAEILGIKRSKTWQGEPYGPKPRNIIIDMQGHGASIIKVTPK